jgi:thiol-disulfide isomerase/thioredoxin
MASMIARLKKHIFPIVLIGGIAIFAFSGRNSATGAEYTFEGKPEIIAATFSSAWCSSCKILEPRLAEVIPDFVDQPVKFVKLDFTLGQRAEIEEQAAAEGLSEIYPRFKGATGFTLLVDSDTGEIVDMLTISHSKSAMRAAIAQSISFATRDEPVQSEQLQSAD